MRLKSIVAASLLVVGMAGQVFAQRTTGSIVGTVTDESGAILPGVTVTLRGAAVVGAQTSTTTVVPIEPRGDSG